MTVPDPWHPGPSHPGPTRRDPTHPSPPDPTLPGLTSPGRLPGSGLDPMPSSPGSGLGPFPPGPASPPDEVPDPSRFAVVATGREDRRRHVVDVPTGELGDPAGLRARCGAPVADVVPGLRAPQADCPGCRLPVTRASAATGK